MSTAPGRLHWVIFSAIAVVLLVAVTQANLTFARSYPGGSDFLTRWVATRDFLFEGRSPYSSETALHIQTLFYGRPADAQAHEDEMRMAYPIYAMLIFTPYALIADFAVARALWMTTLEVSALLLAVLSSRLVQWKPSLVNFVLLIFYSLFGYYSVRSFINGNVVTLLAFLMVLAFFAIQRGHDFLTGGLLALITIKPQLAVLLLIVIFIWAISHQRWALVVWTVAWVAVLTGLGMLFFPDWILQNISDLMLYPGYTPAGTVQAALQELLPWAGLWLGRSLTFLLAVWLVYECYDMWGKSFEHLLMTGCITLIISQWIGIQTDPGNFIILFLPLIWVFAYVQTRWQRWAEFGIGASILILFAGLWTLFLTTLGPGSLQSPVMFFPLPAILLVSFLMIRIGRQA